MKTKRPVSIYFRIILVFILITVPFYIGEVVIVNHGRAQIREESTEAAVARTDYLVNTLEQEILNIQTLEFGCCGDLNFARASYPEFIADSYRKYEILEKVRERLSLIASTSELLDAISVYFPKTDEYLSLPNLTADAVRADRESLQRGVGKEGLQSADGLLRLTVRYPISGGREPDFLLSATISNGQILSHLGEQTQSDEDGFFLLLYGDAWSLSGADSEDAETAAAVQALVGETDFGQREYRSGDSSYLVTWNASNVFGLKLVVVNDTTRIVDRTWKLTATLVFFSFLCLLMSLVFASWIRRILHDPMTSLVEAFSRMRSEDFQYRIREEGSSEFLYIYESFNRMADKIDELINMVYKQKILAQESEYRYLQAQINPHFLYNCFFLLNGQISIGDMETAKVMCRGLGDYFQFITNSAEAMVIPLESEYKQAVTYSEIQMLRFGNRLQIECEPLPEEIRRASVPRLVIQPLVENAFEHGVRGKRDGRIRLWARAEGERLLIAVEDNGGLTDDALADMARWIAEGTSPAGSTALMNIARRLQLFGRGDAALEVSRSELGGLKVQIRIERFREKGDKLCIG